MEMIVDMASGGRIGGRPTALMTFPAFLICQRAACRLIRNTSPISHKTFSGPNVCEMGLPLPFVILMSELPENLDQVSCVARFLEIEGEPIRYSVTQREWLTQA